MEQLDELARRIGARLAARGETLAVAETSTGGLIGAVLSRQPGAASWFAGSIVAYAQALQTGWLAVPRDVIGAAGAVSPEVALELARGARRKLGATWGLAETGIAGPQTGRRSSKPAGLGFFALAGTAGEAQGQTATGHDRRIRNKEAFAQGALQLLDQALTDLA